MSGHISTNALDNVLNFRDVGKTINEFTGKKLLHEGVLFRSARPDDASASDKDVLVNEYGIKTIMDLRTKSEHVKQANKRKEEKRVAAMKSDQSFHEDVEIPGINYLKVNINGKGFERELLWKLSWWQLLKLVFLMVVGKRMEAISILGVNVMKPMGLVGIGYTTLQHCQPELSAAIHHSASSSNYPILLHCTQGKDRTGIITLLLLLLLEVPLEAIDYDYKLSGKELEPARAQMMKEISEIGLPEEFATTPPGWVGKMKAFLEEEYGSVREFLWSIGVGKESMQAIVELLQG